MKKNDVPQPSIWTFVFVAIFFTALSIYSFSKTYHLYSNGIEASGHVTGIKVTTRKLIDTYHPIVTYADAGNIERSFTSDHGSWFKSYKEGDNVKVLYDPDYKTVSINTFWYLWEDTAVWCVLTLLFIRVTVLRIIRRNKYN